jgi:hypothetical protein
MRSNLVSCEDPNVGGPPRIAEASNLPDSMENTSSDAKVAHNAHAGANSKKKTRKPGCILARLRRWRRQAEKNTSAFSARCRKSKKNAEVTIKQLDGVTHKVNPQALTLSSILEKLKGVDPDMFDGHRVELFRKGEENALKDDATIGEGDELFALRRTELTTPKPKKPHGRFQAAFVSALRGTSTRRA